MLHLPPSTIMEYKSNNGVYASATQSPLSSLKHIHRLHGRQVLLPQFNNRPHATFMTIFYTFFLGGRVCCEFFCILSCLHAVYTHCSTPCMKRERNLQKCKWAMGNNKKWQHMIYSYTIHGIVTLSRRRPTRLLHPHPHHPRRRRRCRPRLRHRPNAANTLDRVPPRVRRRVLLLPPGSAVHARRVRGPTCPGSVRLAKSM